jgi:hypothetical protein
MIARTSAAATAMRLLSGPGIWNAIWPAGFGTYQLVLVWNRPGRPIGLDRGAQ